MPSSNEAAQVAGADHVTQTVMPAEFGLGMANLMVVASMVGVGILTTSGYTMAIVGSNHYMLILWVVGGVIAVCGALSLAELSASLPHAGGDYIYLYHAYGPLAGFLSGWVSVLMGFSGPTAASAFAFAKYVLTETNSGNPYAVTNQRLLATAAVLFFAVIHIWGRKQTARLQAWVTGFQIGFLLLLVVAGIAVGWKRAGNLADAGPVNADLLGNMVFSLVYVYYAYTGWNGASYLAGEIRNPRRNLPKAILLGTTAVTVLYLAVNVVYGLALSQADIQAMVHDPANTQKLDVVSPIAQIAAVRLFGPRWTAGLNLVIGVMVLSTLSAYLLQGPRVLYAMARNGQFPAIAARVTRRAGTPAVATLLQVCMTLLLLWTGSFESIIVYASVGLSMFSMLAISAIYVLRRTQPDLPRPFRTPGYPVTPAIYLVLTGMLTIAASYQRPVDFSFALASILAGIPVYYTWTWLARSAARRAHTVDSSQVSPG